MTLDEFKRLMNRLDRTQGNFKRTIKLKELRERRIEKLPQLFLDFVEECKNRGYKMMLVESPFRKEKFKYFVDLYLPEFGIAVFTWTPSSPRSCGKKQFLYNALHWWVNPFFLDSELNNLKHELWKLDRCVKYNQNRAKPRLGFLNKIVIDPTKQRKRIKTVTFEKVGGNNNDGQTESRRVLAANSGRTLSRRNR